MSTFDKIPFPPKDGNVGGGGQLMPVGVDIGVAVVSVVEVNPNVDNGVVDDVVRGLQKFSD